MIVADNSVIVPKFITGRRSAAAAQAARIEGDWRVPPMWRFEFSNVIATMVRGHECEMTDAWDYLDLARIAFNNREVAVDQREAVRFAARFQISAYDAQYVALADAFGVRCLTEDRRLAQRASSHAILLEDFIRGAS